jgi:hypothetical protein
MAVAETPLFLFLVRYRHNGEVIDVYSHGETGADAFSRYLNRMKSWGKNPKDYKFVSAKQIQSTETH